MFWATFLYEDSSIDGIIAHPIWFRILGILQWGILISVFILFARYLMEWWLALICVIVGYVIILAIGTGIEVCVKIFFKRNVANK